MLLCAIENHYNLGERRWNVSGSLATCLQQASSWPQTKILLMVALKNEFMKCSSCFRCETHSISFFPMFCCRWASVFPYLQSGPALFPLLITSQAQEAGRPPGSLICPLVSAGDRGHPICPTSVKCREYTEGTPILVHDSTVAPLHSLPRRDAHATVPPSCLKQGTPCSQPLETIKQC